MSEKPTGPGQRHASVSLWRNISFLLMWSSVAASGFGDRLIQLAALHMLGVQGQDAQASSIQAAIYFFFFLPYLIFGTPAGWLADTLPRKWIMFACDESRALILLVAYVLAPAGVAVAISPQYHWQVFAMIAAVGTMAAIFSPTRNATIPQIVLPSQLQPANAIVLGIAVIASMIGFGIGGRIIESRSVGYGLVMGVLFYGISGTFFAFLRLRPRTGQALGQAPNEYQRLWQAIGYIRRHRPVLQLIGLNVLFWGAANILLAAIAALCKSKTHYAIPSDQIVKHIADLSMVLGLGMLSSSLWVAWMNSRRESGWITMIALLMTSFCMLAMGVNRSFTVGLALSFAVGFAGNTAMICVATLTQSLTPDYIRGRVFGIRDIVSTLSSVIVNLVIWQLGSDVWMVPTLIVTAGVLAVVSLIGLWQQITSGPMGRSLVNVIWRINRAFVLVWHRLHWSGNHRVPGTGPVILAANHTTGIDPLLIQAALPCEVRWVMLKAYRFRFLEPLWQANHPIILEKNSNDLTQLRQILRALKSGDTVGLFPEGAAQREHRTLKPFQPGIGMLAKRSGAQIVPIWVDGTPRTKNMLWHFIMPSRSTVTFGQPYAVDPAMSNQQIADDLRDRILALAP